MLLVALRMHAQAASCPAYSSCAHACTCCCRHVLFKAAPKALEVGLVKGRQQGQQKQVVWHALLRQPKWAGPGRAPLGCACGSATQLRDAAMRTMAQHTLVLVHMILHAAGQRPLCRDGRGLGPALRRHAPALWRQRGRARPLLLVGLGCLVFSKERGCACTMH